MDSRNRGKRERHVVVVVVVVGDRILTNSTEKKRGRELEGRDDLEIKRNSCSWPIEVRSAGRFNPVVITFPKRKIYGIRFKAD